jgi:RimJ/RimL family protein N-acetyltransferase
LIDQLETERLSLRPMRRDDTEALQSLFGDPDFMAAFAEAPFDREQMERWVGRNLRHQEAHGYGLYTVVLRSTGQVIGDCGLEHMVLDGVPVVELGYDLRRDLWGQGFATEAASAVRDHAFGKLGLTRLVSLIRVANGASRRVAGKIGMREIRPLRRHDVLYVLYELHRHDGRPV